MEKAVDFSIQTATVEEIEDINILNAAMRAMKRAGQLWIRVFPDVPVSDKPAEVRMGKGKGSVEYWCARVHPGRILFECEGIDEETAREAFALGAAKLPIKTKFIKRLNSDKGEA